MQIPSSRYLQAMIMLIQQVQVICNYDRTDLSCLICTQCHEVGSVRIKKSTYSTSFVSCIYTEISTNLSGWITSEKYYQYSFHVYLVSAIYIHRYEETIQFIERNGNASSRGWDLYTLVSQTISKQMLVQSPSSPMVA